MALPGKRLRIDTGSGTRLAYFGADPPAARQTLYGSVAGLFLVPRAAGGAAHGAQYHRKKSLNGLGCASGHEFDAIGVGLGCSDGACRMCRGGAAGGCEAGVVGGATGAGVRGWGGVAPLGTLCSAA